MFSVTLEVFVLVFLTSGLLGFMLLWLYYDRRDKRYYDKQRVRRSYFCVRCECLYSSGQRTEVVPCPKCGFKNSPLRF